MVFVDEAKVWIKAGDGGKGCESFHRDRSMRHRKPDGGDGGKGGDVIFVADPSVHTLLDYRYAQHYKAQRGGHGGSRGKTGRRGADCLLRVPVGTLIRDVETGLLLKDLSQIGDRVVAARGGEGGVGNAQRRVPAPPGKGEERRIHLELKMIADVGLIGFPNAGKSTLISALTRARSQSAPYPFTTKHPILGVIHKEEAACTVADLPGLIEGAHEGKGMGFQFLKHAERTRLLVHVIDMAGSEGRDPVEDYRILSQELEAYDERFLQRPRLIAANKMDCDEAQRHWKCFQRTVKEEVIPVSALTHEGCDLLVEKIFERLAGRERLSE